MLKATLKQSDGSMSKIDTKLEKDKQIVSIEERKHDTTKISIG